MIRIDSEKHARLKQISDATSTKMVDIGRHAIDALIAYAEQVGLDSVSFPLRYPQRLAAQAAEIAALRQRNSELEQLLSRIGQAAATDPARAATLTTETACNLPPAVSNIVPKKKQAARKSRPAP